MIKINLLPPGVRGRKASLLLQLPWKKIGIGAGGLVGMVSLWLLVGNFFVSRNLNRLAAQWESMAPDRARLEETKANLRALQNRASVLKGLKAPEGLWAPRLNLLSDSLVRNLWFTALVLLTPRNEMKQFLTEQFKDLDLSMMDIPGEATPPEGPVPPVISRTRLFLTGSALVGAEKAEAAISRFLQRLKEHPDFPRWFSGVELKDVAHAQIKDQEVSAFVAVLYPTGG